MAFANFLVILTFWYVRRKWARCVVPSVCPNPYGILAEMEDNNHDYVFFPCILLTPVTPVQTHTPTESWLSSMCAAGFVLIWCSQHRKQNCCNIKRDFSNVFFFQASFYSCLFYQKYCIFLLSQLVFNDIGAISLLSFLSHGKRSLTKMFSFSCKCLLAYVSMLVCLATLKWT